MSLKIADKVTVLPLATTLAIDVDRVLESAVGQMTEAIVIGADKEGKFYFAFSHDDELQAKVLWLLEKAKLCLLTGQEIGGDD